jgi:hypothetical protein
LRQFDVVVPAAGDTHHALRISPDRSSSSPARSGSTSPRRPLRRRDPGGDLLHDVGLQSVEAVVRESLARVAARVPPLKQQLLLRRLSSWPERVACRRRAPELADSSLLVRTTSTVICACRAGIAGTAAALVVAEDGRGENLRRPRPVGALAELASRRMAGDCVAAARSHQPDRHLADSLSQATTAFRSAACSPLWRKPVRYGGDWRSEGASRTATSRPCSANVGRERTRKLPSPHFIDPLANICRPAVPAGQEHHRGLRRRGRQDEHALRDAGARRDVDDFWLACPKRRDEAGENDETKQLRLHGSMSPAEAKSRSSAGSSSGLRSRRDRSTRRLHS